MLSMSMKPETKVSANSSSLTVAVKGDGLDKPVRLTIPVKIVKY